MNERPINIRLGWKTPDRQRLIEFCLQRLTSPHWAFLGLTGSGKSRLLTDLALQMIDRAAA